MKFYYKDGEYRLTRDNENKSSFFWQGLADKVEGVFEVDEFTFWEDFNGETRQVFINTSNVIKEHEQAMKFFEKWNCAYGDTVEIDYSIIRRITDITEKMLLKKIEAKKNELKEKERKEAIKEWEFRRKHGCKGCENLIRWNDDYMCNISGDTLEEVTKPELHGNTYYLFEKEAKPSVNCPYRVKE